MQQFTRRVGQALWVCIWVCQRITSYARAQEVRRCTTLPKLLHARLLRRSLERVVSGHKHPCIPGIKTETHSRMWVFTLKLDDAFCVGRVVVWLSHPSMVTRVLLISGRVQATRMRVVFEFPGRKLRDRKEQWERYSDSNGQSQFWRACDIPRARAWTQLSNDLSEQSSS